MSSDIRVGGVNDLNISSKSVCQFYENNWDPLSSAEWIPYQDSNWRQVWYDDSLSLSIKYQYAKNADLSGIGIWALGYDDEHPELWDALFNEFYYELLAFHLI